MQFAPTSTDRPDGLVLLAAERTVTVTREEHHQDVLAGRTGRVVVELRPCMITSGKHAGRDGLEVTLDGRRVGGLTWLMAQRYRHAVDALVVRGFRVGCEAGDPDERGHPRRAASASIAAAARGRRRGRRGAGGRVRARQRFSRRGADLLPVAPPRRRRGADRRGVPIASDVDCKDGSGNGPAYVSGPVRVTGTDIYGLDRNKDGVACE
jgi:hypothetical protein